MAATKKQMLFDRIWTTGNKDVLMQEYVLADPTTLSPEALELRKYIIWRWDARNETFRFHGHAGHDPMRLPVHV